MVSLSFAHQAQTPSNVEAAEYEPNSDRWFVSNGNSILVTADEGESWSVFGDGGATHGMEVLGTTLFAIQSNVIRAFDVVTGEQLGSLSPAGVGFLNGMGSESGPFGDLLVVSDFAEGSLLRIDVSDPTDMVASTLVANTGTTPNGVTIQNGVATVVNWGNNADILQVDVATGEVTTLIDGTGLGFCDGVDWANGSLIVSSWNPQRISRFTPNATAPTGWDVETLVQGVAVEQSGRPQRQLQWRPVRRGLQWEQHSLLWRFAHGFRSPRGQSALDSGLIDRQWRIGPNRRGRTLDRSRLRCDGPFVGRIGCPAPFCWRAELDL